MVPDGGGPGSRHRTLSRLVRRARIEASLSQAELGRKIGRTQNWVSQREIGRLLLRFTDVEDIATACSKPLDFFHTRSAAAP